MTADEYAAQLDAVADYLNEWGVADVVRAGIQVRSNDDLRCNVLLFAAFSTVSGLIDRFTCRFAVYRQYIYQTCGVLQPLTRPVTCFALHRRVPAPGARGTTTVAAPRPFPFRWMSTLRAAAAASSMHDPGFQSERRCGNTGVERART